MIDITIKIGGEAGFGVMTTGQILGKIATRSGYHAFEYSEYPSLIRGGHNVVEVRISDGPVYSQEHKCDILVCLNKETYELHRNELKEGAVVLIDEEKNDISGSKIAGKNITYINLPFNRILSEGGFPTVMINNIAIGALIHIIGADLNILKNMVVESFAKKGEEVINKNLAVASQGLDYAKKGLSGGYKIKIPKKPDAEPRLYLTGNEMIGYAALAAGCRFYGAYPMTPSSALLHYVASQADKVDMVVKHAEDEISVINMALGASWAGVRSMVGTSGGGFALMVEAVSLAGITETPIVIMMGMRPGPATGMPTWTEQGDLLFIIHSGHGEFPKIVLAPGDLEEAYKLTVEAFNLADKYQTPVFVMADKYLLEGHQSVDELRIKNYELRINRGKLLSRDELDKIKEYKRYLVMEDGISPRVIPGMKGSLHQANSYEHTEDGHTTEDALERIKQVDKRNRKLTTYLSEDASLPVLYGDSKALLTLVSWGSMKAPILQAMRECGDKFNYLHFTHIWPIPKKELKDLLSKYKNLLLVENNSTAQLGQLITMITGIEIKNKLLKYDGRPLYPEEIFKKVNELI